jgi:hypothetical protein
MKIDHLSPAKQGIVNAAMEAGYNATQHGNNEIFLLKGRTTQSKGVIGWGDGQITRADTRLDLAKPMTIIDAKKHLAI